MSTAAITPMSTGFELPSAAKTISANRNSGIDWIISAIREMRLADEPRRGSRWLRRAGRR